MSNKKANDVAVRVNNVSKTFKLPHEKHTSIKSVALNFLSKKEYEKQNALKDISFEVKKGEFFGIVGRNGSGKSTLLKCLAGVYSPNKGSVQINGMLIPFIELGVGFNPELSGRDNVFLNGALLGFSRQQVLEMYDEIVEFAELEDFMDQKLKNYSSGMQVRLAFSIAIRAQGDILVLDEVLAVGDTLFQQKCFNYFLQLKKNKKTVLLVSHDANALRQYCTNGILIEEGEIVSRGKIDDVLNDYIDIVSNKEAEISNKSKASTANSKRKGTGKVIIKNVETQNTKEQGQNHFTNEEDEIIINATFEAIDGVESPTYGVVIKNASGEKIFATNNLWLSQKSHNLEKNQTQEISWKVPNIFNTGEYFISIAVASFSGKETFDSQDDRQSFNVRKKETSSGLINPKHKMLIHEL